MELRELACRLIDSDQDMRRELLANVDGRAAELSGILQELCYEAWTNGPDRVAGIASTLDLLSNICCDPAVRGHAAWANAIDRLVRGELDECLSNLSEAESIFATSGLSLFAARTQTSRIYPLALLGRYDEAIACGEAARTTFIEHRDNYSAGKIEHNIGNLFWRRERYSEAEPYLESAHSRFLEIGDRRQLAMVENCQAFVKTLQNRFREAELIYKRALARACDNELFVTEAEIETGMSNLYLFQGRLELALRYMEQARTKYDQLNMPAQSASCELEVADIYLEINLLPEAQRLYQELEVKFTDLGMRSELARAVQNHARASLLSDHIETAARNLDRAEELFEAEGNRVSVGSIRLTRAQMRLKEGKLRDAMIEAEGALSMLREHGNVRHELSARWLAAEIRRRAGSRKEAISELEAILPDARTQSNQVAYLCLLSLGKATGDIDRFKEAVQFVESQRFSLSGEEFRIAYFSDKLEPYHELTKHSISQGRLSEALIWHERSRARTLLEATPSTGRFCRELRRLREELNWYYSRLERPQTQPISGSGRAAVFNRISELEARYSEIARRSGIEGSSGESADESFDVESLQRRMADTCIVEFTDYEGAIGAFVITSSGLEYFDRIADSVEVGAEVRRLLFQVGTGRLATMLSETGAAAANDRLLRSSRRLFEMLVRPLESHLAGSRLVFVPAGFLHGLPFNLLHDGKRFLIERVECALAPSAHVLNQKLGEPVPALRKVVAVGVADERAPGVAAEIEGISKLFEGAITLTNERATAKNIATAVTDRDIVHIACHGRYRSDNPAFSSLSLWEESLTPAEIAGLPLRNRIVILSSCESGINEVRPGEELIGLTRAFFAAGARSLVISRWRADDTATRILMDKFYAGLLSGVGPAAALRAAQIASIRDGSAPYLWAPFYVTGGW